MLRQEEWMDIWSLNQQGLSNRAIARKLGLHRNTIKKHLEAEGFPRYSIVTRHSGLTPFHGMIKDWLSQDDYQGTRIWELVVQQGFEGSYETVKRFVRTVKEERSRVAYLRFETHPGRQAQVDFGDFKIIGPDGREETLYCFVMVLGFSRHMYVEFIEHCTMTVFLDCHKRAFGFFGGVPGESLYDNMKNVVVKRLVGQAKFNATFLDFARHYRFKPLAAPPYAPWCKGKVERPIDYIRERFWRGYQFTSMERANRDMRHWLGTVAFERIHGTTRQKVSERFAVEKPRLGRIPQRPYDTSEKVARKVYKDCLVSFGANRYMVPHAYVGKRVVVKVKNGLVRIFHDDTFLVLYRIPEGKGHILTEPRFVHALRKDAEQQRRKYHVPAGKGKATRGLLKHGLRFETVQRRPLSEYDRIAGGSSCPR
jgi:transposase